MKNKERLMGFLVSVIISGAMGALSAFMLTIVNPDITKLTPVGKIYFSNTMLSIAVGILIAIFIPLGKLGQALAAKAGAMPPSPKFMLLNSLPISLGNTLIVSTVVSLIGVASARSNMSEEVLNSVPPFAVMWFGNWIKLLLPTFILGYVLAMLLVPLFIRLLKIGPKPGMRPPFPPHPGN